MDLVFTTEARFIKDDFGHIASPDNAFGKTLWNRYLQVFDRILVVARIKRVSNSIDIDLVCNDDKVSFLELPDYQGALGFFKKKKTIQSIIDSQAIKGRAYLCRVPGMLGSIMAQKLRRYGLPYGVEVVGDPFDSFSSIHHPFSFILKHTESRRLHKTIKGSSVLLYVTQFTLQKRYPPPTSDCYIASNVRLTEKSFEHRDRFFDGSVPLRILSIGSLERLYKAPDIAIDALAFLREEGCNCKWTWIGGGRHLADLREYVHKRELDSYMDFVGAKKAGEEVRSYLRNADLFVLPSRTEGLPRVILEAQAMSVPCLGSSVGGIPELLPQEDLFPPDNPEALARKITRLYDNPILFEQKARLAYENAFQYREELLQERRNQFYTKLRVLSLS